VTRPSRSASEALVSSSLKLVALRAAAEGVRPADALEVLRSARRLDDPVDGDVLGDDDPSQLLFSLRCCLGCELSALPLANALEL
jgi:hypothetical protein